MRWRTTAVYLAVLLIVGGYFYYFEVLKNEQKQIEEKEAKRVFVFNPDSVSQIEIGSGEQAVRLEKKEGWHIVQPITSEVDRTIFDGLFSELRDLETTRSLGAVPADLGPYGLAQPALKVRFQADGQWRELLVGSENPSGDSRYAKKGEGNELFLIDKRAWQSLNKNLKDLRKKDLFAWHSDQVQAFNIEWASGEKLTFERSATGKGWNEAGRPDLKINGKRVDRLLDQLQWLRAVDFVDPGEKPKTLSLKLVIQLKGGKESQLVLGELDKTAMQVVADSPGLPSPVRISSNIFQEVPKSPETFQDRSLLALDPGEVRGLKWKRGEAEGSAARTDQGKWEAGGKAIEDPWLINGLVEDAAQVEYTETSEYAPPGPEAGLNRVDFTGPDGQSVRISWAALPEQGKEPVFVKMEKGEKILYVKVPAQELKRIDQSLEDLAGEKKQK